MNYLTDIYRKYLNAKDNFIYQSFRSPKDFFNLKTLINALKLKTFSSSYHDMKKFIPNEHLQYLLSFQTLYIGISPFSGPSIYNIIPMIELLYGVWFIKGRMYQYAKALERRFKELGGTIQYHSEIKQVVTSGRKVTGIQVNDDTIPVDAADNNNVEQFQLIKGIWESVKNGKPNTSLGKNLQLIFQVFQIPEKLIDEMILGQEEDLKKVVIKTQSDLRNYCFRVAGTVGLMIIPILTEKKLTDYDKKQIVNVRIALQLTNIIRDVKEDYEHGYVYLPQLMLDEFEVSPTELGQSTVSPNLRHLIQSLSEEAFSLYYSKFKVLKLLEQRQAKIALRLAIDGYEAI
ncbi:squalene/phytoene synthase family protein [Fructilactobacillus sanfranciscensis]|uniref:squalene/phytoene synthase family protein n=1 Tax=Fructilactobacillus sanfranciscensis TaxID=1625 RepID=UPI00384D79DD